MARNNRVEDKTPCTVCGKNISPESVAAYGGKCSQCHRLERVTVYCGKCGSPREISRGYAESAEFKNSVCNRCAQKSHGRTGYPKQMRRPTRQTPSISVNGCVLIPAKERRCDAYFDCPNGFCAPLLGIPAEQECAFQAGLCGFKGWKCQEGSKPGKMSAQQLEEVNEYLKTQASQNNVEMRLTAGWARSRTKGAK